MEANFYAFDEKGEQNISLAASDVDIIEGEVEQLVIKVENPIQVPPRPISAVLTIDVSGSMSYTDNISLAQEGALSFLDLVDLSTSEVAVTNFDDVSLISSDLTQDKLRLKKAIGQLGIRYGTNYNEGLMNRFSGGLSVLENGENERTVIFLTEGLGDVDVNQIVNRAKSINAKVYCIALKLDAPQSLFSISKSTGGICFSNVSSKADLIKAYSLIFRHVSGNSPSKVFWESKARCANNIQGVMNVNELGIESNGWRYSLLGDKKVNLKIGQRYLRMHEPLAGEWAESSIDLEAKAGDIEIVKIESNSENLDWSHLSFPMTLSEGNPGVIPVRYKSDNPKFEATTIRIHHSCGVEHVVWSLTSDKTSKLPIHLDYPNGGEHFISGETRSIRWSGVTNSNKAKLSYSIDDGVNWVPLASEIRDDKFQWRVPKVSSSKALVHVETTGETKAFKPGYDVVLEKEFQAGTWGINGLLTLSPDETKILMVDRLNMAVMDLLTGEILTSFKIEDNRFKPWFSASGDYVYVPREPFESEMFSKNLKQIFTSVTAVDPLKNEYLSGPYQAEFKNKLYYELNKNGVLQVKEGPSLTVIKEYRHPEGWGAFLSCDGTYVVHRISGKSKKTTIRVTRLGDLSTVMEKTVAASKDGYSWFQSAYVSKDQRTVVFHNYDETNVYDLKTGEHKFNVSAKDQKYYRIQDTENGMFHRLNGAFGMFNSNTGEEYFKIKGGNEIVISRLGNYAATLAYINGNPGLRVYKLNTKGKAIGSDQSDAVFTIVSPRFKLKNAAFPPVEIGSNEDKVFLELLANESDLSIEMESVKVKGRDAASFSLVSGGDPQVLASQKMASLELNFLPKREGTHEALLVVKTNYGIYESKITAEGVAPKALLSIHDINLGSHTVGTRLDSVISKVLLNISKENIVISKLELLSADEDQFDLTTQPLTLSKKQSLNLSLSFTAIRRGKTSAQVLLHSPQFPRALPVNVYAEVEAPKVYTLKLLTKSKTTRRIMQQPFSVEVFAEEESIKTDRTSSGELAVSLHADHLYTVKVKLAEGREAEERIDLRDHDADQEIIRVLLIDDEEKSDSPDILYVGRLLDEVTGESIAGEIVLMEDNGTRLDSTDGNEYSYQVSKSKEVKIYGSSRGYLPRIIPIEINANPKPNNYILDILLTPVVVGKSIKLDNVLFVQGKPELLPGSDEQLNLLKIYLLDNPEAKIELAGHTDNRGSVTANYRLSNERVEIIKEYLIGHGIDKKRLSGKGYGGSVPIASNKTEETRRLNRRVEFKVL
jgi:outer membrane protein OmpA-like peptidoglycan-associated protein